MALDYQAQVSLGLMAGTLAAWLKDNPNQPEADDSGLGDADEFGMYAMATGFMRMYHELYQLGVLETLDTLRPTEGSVN